MYTSQHQSINMPWLYNILQTTVDSRYLELAYLE